MCGFCYFKALNQNAELRSRLNRIHSESIICDQVVSVNIIPSPDEVRLILNRCRVPIFLASKFTAYFCLFISSSFTVNKSSLHKYLCRWQFNVLWSKGYIRVWHHLFLVISVYFYLFLCSPVVSGEHRNKYLIYISTPTC